MAGVTVSRINFASREYRNTDVATDAGVAARDLLSEKLTLQSLFLNESDAEDFRDDVLAMRAPGRHTWTVEIAREKDAGEVGDTITLVTDRFGLGTKNFLIKGKKFSIDTPFSTYTLYGPE
jgi:hypothetical protein